LFIANHSAFQHLVALLAARRRALQIAAHTHAHTVSRRCLSQWRSLAIHSRQSTLEIANAFFVTHAARRVLRALARRVELRAATRARKLRLLQYLTARAFPAQQASAFRAWSALYRRRVAQKAALVVWTRRAGWPAAAHALERWRVWARQQALCRSMKRSSDLARLRAAYRHWASGTWSGEGNQSIRQ
jgi:hypothetical protein